MKLAIVTGANKGIGEGLVRHLVKRYKGEEKLRVYLTARDTARGTETLEKIRREIGDSSPNSDIAYHQLDVTDQESIDALVRHLKSEYGSECVDILINNAGWAARGPEWSYEIARKTMDCNYYGVRQVTEALLPLMKPKGRIINISSSVGRLKLFSPELQKQYSRSDLAVPELDRLQEMFVSGVRDDTYQTLGYPQQSYGVTKAGVTAYTKILARLHKDDPRNLFFAAVCPGWVQTDMNRGKGHLTVDQAVETPIYLALSDEGRIFANNGEFWSRKTVAIW